MKNRLLVSFAIVASALLVPLAAAAQEEVRGLRDLVGARGRDGQTQMESRGYVYVRTEKSGDSSYTYWREPRSARCVSVRTANGVYASIVYAPDFDCGGAAAAAPAPETGSGDSFETVCGVEVGGKEYAYRCRLRSEGCKGEGYCRSIVTMPDNEYTITWHKNDEIEVKFSGMNPMRSKSSFRDGQTRFDLEGKTYFVYRSPERARKELARVQ